MRVIDVPTLERPREKIIEYGVNNLTDSELLAILLSSGTKEKSALEVAFELLLKVGNLYNLENIHLKELQEIKGIGLAKAATIMAAIELGRRIFLSTTSNKINFSSSLDIYQYSRYLFHGKKQEYFYCFYVDSKKDLIASKLLFVGTINRSAVHPREIFKEAYKNSASAIICVHNHPSGIVTPSKKDIEFTNDLIKIGIFQGIPILDHLIVSEDKYYSFGENKISS